MTENIIEGPMKKYFPSISASLNFLKNSPYERQTEIRLSKR